LRLAPVSASDSVSGPNSAFWAPAGEGEAVGACPVLSQARRVLPSPLLLGGRLRLVLCAG